MVQPGKSIEDESAGRCCQRPCRARVPLRYVIANGSFEHGRLRRLHGPQTFRRASPAVDEIEKKLKNSAAVTVENPSRNKEIRTEDRTPSKNASCEYLLRMPSPSLTVRIWVVRGTNNS